MRSWVREKNRNKFTAERSTVYLVHVPLRGMEKGVGVREWTQPRVNGNGSGKRAGEREGEEDFDGVAVEGPRIEDVRRYLRAFYHGVSVEMLPGKLSFTSDIVSSPKTETKRRKKSVDGEKKAEPEILWLKLPSSDECIGIRTRATPQGAFSHQLNLNDLLDAAIEILPRDAYALLMLVNHDIYEDEDDDFACGRAYGASRVAVVSTARYNPVLDGGMGVEREHGWPGSHCGEYVRKCCGGDGSGDGRRKKRRKIQSAKLQGLSREGGRSPMHAALKAHMSLPALNASSSKEALEGLWLGRVCKTASHELGHCFGIDHCVYYACVMQGTASLVEDARQPPYLCPVDLAKVLRATGADERERYKALLEVCEGWGEVHLFRAFGAWLRARLEGEGSGEQ